MGGGVLDSVAQKLERKNKKGADEKLEEFIIDLAGVRVICFDTEQIYMIAGKIVEAGAFDILKVKDYVRKPKDNGYQSYHIIMGVRGIKVELQIRTILMDAWSSLDSILVYKKTTPITSEMKKDKVGCYTNRELSWLSFNERVHDEAANARVPLAERLTFASIYQTNLDEFYMVRVGTLMMQMNSKDKIIENKTGMSSEEQVQKILKRTRELEKKKAKIYEQLMGELEPHGIRIIR